MVWIDCEMTGLDPDRHTLIEIATIITDFDLNIIDRGPDLAIKLSPAKSRTMDPWSRRTHTASGLLERCKTEGVAMADAEKKTLAFIKRYCAPKTAPLCGNSVWCDRMFIKLQMPALDEFLHYRTIDVSSFKEVGTRWSVNAIGGAPRKGDKHRALEDIRESLAELRHYRDRWLAPQRAPKAAEAKAESKAETRP